MGCYHHGHHEYYTPTTECGKRISTGVDHIRLEALNCYEELARSTFADESAGLVMIVS